jgi:hypothetical protein
VALVTRRSGRRRSGRPYQPFPERHNAWLARLLVIFVGVALVVTLLAITFNSAK